MGHAVADPECLGYTVMYDDIVGPFNCGNIIINFPGGSDDKASVYNAGDPGSIPGLEDPLGKEMATHSRTIAWKIPQTEEPGRLQSMGSQRVGHD